VAIEGLRGATIAVSQMHILPLEWRDGCMEGDAVTDQEAADGRAGQGRLAQVLALRGGSAEPEAPFVIEHREELIYMLCQAAELEHGIMIQYLFAAYSLKQGADEGLNATQRETVSRWRRTLLRVATEEMLHLALVQNLLSAIGAAPHLTRPNLPAPVHHYPAGVNLMLMPFSEQALLHFIYLERPEGLPFAGAPGLDDVPEHDVLPPLASDDIVPQLQDFATISHLYRSIEDGIAHLAEKIGEAHLFVGPPRAQATATHFGLPELVAITDVASAQQAIDIILEQGEGARGAWQTSHFGQFVAILEEYRTTLAEHPDFSPARPVTFATVRRSEYDTSVPLIEDQLTAKCTDLFNVGYELLVLIMERYFAHTDETDDQLSTLAKTTRVLMNGMLSPVGNLVTRLPAGPHLPGRAAGPSFEMFYVGDDLLPHRNSAWILLEERAREAAALAGAIASAAPEHVAQVVGTAQKTLTAVADSLAAHFADWGAASRFATSTAGDAEESSPSAAPVPPGPPRSSGVFERDIKTLFRRKDRDSMRIAFDLWSFDDVFQHADAIRRRVEEGTMPCDGAWSVEQIATFSRWIDAGKPE
jgi:hypothetical protein